MTLHVKVGEQFASFLKRIIPDEAGKIMATAADELCETVKKHLAKIAPTRHAWANKLGATPTRHLYKGIDGAYPSHDDTSATVTIPLPGLNRALRDITITPKNARYLTIPVHALSYGKKVHVLKSLGWNIFRPKGHYILMGKQKASNEKPVALYALKKSILQHQDRSLLPSDRELQRAAEIGMQRAIIYLAS